MNAIMNAFRFEIFLTSCRTSLSFGGSRPEMMSACPKLCTNCERSFSLGWLFCSHCWTSNLESRVKATSVLEAPTTLAYMERKAEVGARWGLRWGLRIPERWGDSKMVPSRFSHSCSELPINLCPSISKQEDISCLVGG